MEKKKCLYCDKNIYGRDDKKFCGDSCRHKYWAKVRRNKKEPYKKQCGYCGKDFETNNRVKNYCCTKHQLAAAVIRRRYSRQEASAKNGNKKKVLTTY